MDAHEPEIRHENYESFILLLSVLSLANLALVFLFASPAIADIIRTIDIALSFVLLLDFGYRFFSAPDRSSYFLRGFGWLDLIGSLPIPFLRLGRLYRVVWVTRRLRPARSGVFRRMLHERAETALLGVLFLTIVLLEAASAFMLSIEAQAPDSNIRTASDALWWTWVTVTTVGYGDRYPVTDVGRWIGVITLAVGVGLFGTLTGYLANAFLRPHAQYEVEAHAREERFRAEIALIREQLGVPDDRAPVPDGQTQPASAEGSRDATEAADPVGR